MKNNNRTDRTAKYRKLEFIASVFDNVTIAVKQFSTACENYINSEDYKRMKLELTNQGAVTKCERFA